MEYGNNARSTHFTGDRRDAPNTNGVYLFKKAKPDKRPKPGVGVTLPPETDDPGAPPEGRTRLRLLAQRAGR